MPNRTCKLSQLISYVDYHIELHSINLNEYIKGFYYMVLFEKLPCQPLAITDKKGKKENDE